MGGVESGEMIYSDVRAYICYDKFYMKVRDREKSDGYR